MNTLVASLSGTVLMIAAVMELLVHHDGKHLRRWATILAAFGFAMLSVRYFYLVHTEDLGRLNIFGTGSIGAIALGRIIACAVELRK